MSVPLLVLELREGEIYLSAVDRKHVLEAISFLVKNYAKLEEREQRQFTTYEFRDGEA